MVQNMFVGGSDSTASIVEWTIAELITHPNEMRKLQDEIRMAIHRGGDNHSVTCATSGRCLRRRSVCTYRRLSCNGRRSRTPSCSATMSQRAPASSSMSGPSHWTPPHGSAPRSSCRSGGSGTTTGPRWRIITRRRRRRGTTSRSCHSGVGGEGALGAGFAMARRRASADEPAVPVRLGAIGRWAVDGRHG